MISNEEEPRLTLARVEKFQQQVAELRRVETNPINYRLSVDAYLAEIDRMNLEVRDYLSLHPSEVTRDETVPVNTQVTDSALT